jgi:hypothetical protein
VTDQNGALSDKVSTMLAGTDGPGVPADVPVAIPGHFAENITPSGTGIIDSGESASGDGGLFEGLPFDNHELMVAAGEAVAISAGVVMLARVAFAVRASAPSAALSAQFFLANARLIPAYCGGLQETVNRQVSAAAAGAARLGEASGVRASAVKVTAAADDYKQAIRDGFLRGAGQPGTGIGTRDDGASDTRLLMQLGMLLGTVYLAFLTVWFWATRLRWNPRM